MAFDYIAGTAANVLSAALAFGGDTADTLYPEANLIDGWPARPFRFATVMSNRVKSFDLGAAVAPTWWSFHGHNLDAGITSVIIRSDDNGSFISPVVEATLTSYESPSFFTLIASPTSHRYWSVQFMGANTSGAVIEIGALVAGVKQSLTHTQLASWSMTVEGAQTRQTGGDIRQAFAARLSDHAQRVVSLSFVAESYAERDEIDALFTATRFGEQPFVFAPDADDKHTIHGRLPRSYTWERIPGPNGGYHRTSFEVEEDPYSLTLSGA